MQTTLLTNHGGQEPVPWQELEAFSPQNALLSPGRLQKQTSENHGKP